MNGLIKQDCLSCIYLNENGYCSNNKSVMFGIKTNSTVPQICKDRRYYTNESVKKYNKKLKIESIYDYE